MNSFRPVTLAVLSLTALVAQPQAQPTHDLSWAYPVPDKTPPPNQDNGAPKRLPGSTKAYTQQQIDDQFAPPDWFPDQHATPPQVILKGARPGVQACGSCHLMSGLGHPESGNLAGLPPEYFLRQMADFKTGARKDPPEFTASARAARMNGIAKVISEDDARAAAEYFASLKPEVYYKVVETDTVPKSWVNGGRMRLPLPSGGTEPLAHRIITMPQDAERVELRDPHSGFIAYVPKGSLKKGESLVTTNSLSGKTLNCTICHGEGLKGLGDVPRIAGLHPIYIVRQLYNFKTGASNGTSAALMKRVVANLTEDDMIAIAAYVAAQAP